MKSLHVGVDLLIDLGNSRVKWAMKRAHEWVVGAAVSRMEGLTDWAISLADQERPQRILISNSAGPADHASRDGRSADTALSGPRGVEGSGL